MSTGLRAALVAIFAMVFSLIGCSKGDGVTGRYESGDVAGVMSVELKPDYTFTISLGSSKLTGNYTLEAETITLQVIDIEGRARRKADDTPIKGLFSESRSKLKLSVNDVELEFKRK
ncbi:MAG: hypothetical protein U0R49_12850 [Fimbriimonadales bacterium]